MSNAPADQHSDGVNLSDADKLETLYIEYREDLPEFRAPRYNSMNNELDRYHYLKKNFEKVFKAQAWPVNLEFQRFPAKTPEGAKVLHVNFLSLRSANPIELELRLYITVSEGGEKEDLAVTRVTHAPSPIFSSASIERDLDQIYTEAAEKIVPALNRTLFEE